MKDVVELANYVYPQNDLITIRTKRISLRKAKFDPTIALILHLIYGL